MQSCAPTRGLIEEGVRELGVQRERIWKHGVVPPERESDPKACLLFPSGVHVSLLQSVKQSQFLHDSDGWVLLDTDSGFQLATVCLSPTQILTVCFGSSG